MIRFKIELSYNGYRIHNSKNRTSVLSHECPMVAWKNLTQQLQVLENAAWNDIEELRAAIKEPVKVQMIHTLSYLDTIPPFYYYEHLRKVMELRGVNAPAVRIKKLAEYCITHKVEALTVEWMRSSQYRLSLSGAMQGYLLIGNDKVYSWEDQGHKHIHSKLYFERFGIRPTLENVVWYIKEVQNVLTK